MGSWGERSDTLFSSEKEVTAIPHGCRTLLLSPPSLSSQPSRLDAVLQAHDRQSTDLQMLDRLALGLVTLPASTYDTVLLLAGSDGSQSQDSSLIQRAVIEQVAAALKPGGRLQCQEGTASLCASLVPSEAILAGLIPDPGQAGFLKPDYGQEQQVVPLQFGRGAKAAVASAQKPVATRTDQVSRPQRVAVALHGVEEPGALLAAGSPAHPTSLTLQNNGIVSLGDDDDDDLIDEDELLDENDLSLPIFQREFSIPSRTPSHTSFQSFFPLLSFLVASWCC